MLTTATKSRPPILVAEDEHQRLVDLALAAMDRTPGAADLFVELSRANTVKALPSGVIGVDSVVTFDYDGACYRDFALVDPHRADFAEGRISIITTVGAMLLGLAEGQSIAWTGENGRSHALTVIKVSERDARRAAVQRD